MFDVWTLENQKLIDVNYTTPVCDDRCSRSQTRCEFIAGFSKKIFSCINCAINQTREKLFMMISFDFYALSLKKEEKYLSGFENGKKAMQTRFHVNFFRWSDEKLGKGWKLEGFIGKVKRTWNEETFGFEFIWNFK